MLTVVCEAPGRLAMRECPVPERGPDEILVRIRRVGVCGTDLHIFDGTQPYLSYPRVMGHELAGVAEEVPEGDDVRVGDVVYIVPYISCGTCGACRADRTNCCRRLQVLGVHRDGGMADYVSVPKRFVRAAAGLSLDQAAMVEFLAIGAHAVRRSRAGAGQRGLVVGAGPIGIAVALFARLRGVAVTMLDARRDRLAFCERDLDLPSVVAVGPGDEGELAALTEGEMFDLVFDATGNPRAMERGFRLVAHGGTYVLVSIVSGDISFSDPEFHKREISLLGSRNATVEDFETAVAALRAGAIPADRLNTHRMPLADVSASFARLLDPGEGVVKALIEV